MGDPSAPASKAYLVTFELIYVCIKNHTFERFSGMERFMFATLVQKIYCIGRPMDRFSQMADAKAKGDFVDSNVKPQRRLVAYLTSWAA